jgi:LmbE family N-acetylglucosaminyl deacetylase
MVNVLFIGAHPDDIELGCGGTLIKHIKNKDNVFAIIASDGEKGNGGNKYNRLSETKKAMSEAGLKESNIFFLHIPDTMFAEYRKRIFNEIERICEEKDIQMVYTHTNKEYHQDHIVVFEETLRGARRVPSIVSYESNAHTLSSFTPNFFVDISDLLNKKSILLNCHISQIGKEYFKNGFESVARFRGSQAKIKYAEAFEIVRLVSS